jgi:hypothetical protein
LIEFPDRTAIRLRKPWRERLADVQARYLENRTPENRAEVMRVLKIFAALVVRGEVPAEDL